MKMGKTHFGLKMDSEVTAAFLERFLIIFTKLLDDFNDFEIILKGLNSKEH